MSFRSVSGCQVMSNSCPTLVKWVPVIFSDWTMWRVLTQNPVLGLETINHSSHWGRIKAGSGRPLQLLSQSRCLCTQVPHPHKVFILPSCTFYLSVSNISSENLNEISQCVLEGAFLFSNVLIRRRQWHPTPVLLPGKSHGRRSLVGCSPWGRKESDMTERFHFHFSLFMNWRRKWQPTPVFLPGESQGRGSLVGCRLWGRTELDTTEAT